MKSGYDWFRDVKAALGRRGIQSELDLTSGVVWIPRQPDLAGSPRLGLNDEYLIFYRDAAAFEGDGDETLADFPATDPEVYDGIKTSVARAVASVTAKALRRVDAGARTGAARVKLVKGVKIAVKKDAPGAVMPYCATLTSGGGWLGSFTGKTAKAARDRALVDARTRGLTRT